MNTGIMCNVDGRVVQTHPAFRTIRNRIDLAVDNRLLVSITEDTAIDIKYSSQHIRSLQLFELFMLMSLQISWNILFYTN